MSESAKKKQKFEQAMGQLEKIVTDIEQGQIGLEDSIDRYEQGMKLIGHCRAILEQAEKRIETITKESLPKEEKQS